MASMVSGSLGCRSVGDGTRRARRIARVLAAIALFAALGPAAIVESPPVAIAQPKKPGAKDPKLAEAKKWFDVGAEAYGKGRHEEAIAAWEKSYELSGKPLIFESIANAYERLGQPKKAREYLSRWREAAPESEHALLDERIANLDERIAREEAQANARQKDEEKKKREEEEAKKRGSEARAAADNARERRMWIGLGAGGLGVLAIGTGVVLGVVSVGSRPDPSTTCDVMGDKPLCLSSARPGIEQSQTLALAGDITWIAGSVLAATGAVLVITSRLSDAPKPSPQEPSSAPPPAGWLRFGPVQGGMGPSVGVSAQAVF